MNKYIGVIAVVIIIVGFLIYIIGVVGGTGAEDKSIEASRDYYKTIFDDDSDADDARDASDDVIDATEELNMWSNLLAIGHALAYLGIAIGFLAFIFPERRKQYYYEQPPPPPPPQPRIKS